MTGTVDFFLIAEATEEELETAGRPSSTDKNVRMAWSFKKTAKRKGVFQFHWENIPSARFMWKAA